VAVIAVWHAFYHPGDPWSFIMLVNPRCPHWHCADLAVGRWMRDFLDGNASTFETERG